MQLTLAFIKWIFTRIGERLVALNIAFRRDLCREPGVSLFAWAALTVLSSVVVFFVLLGIQVIIGIQIPIQVWLSYIVSSVLYLIYTSFSVMYNAFKAERADLFETIKNGK